MNERFAHMHEAAQFAIECSEVAFKLFLHERKGVPYPMTDDAAVASALELLGIRSRDDIRTDEAAASQWRALRAEFQEWRNS